jgi:hypothetical protein
MDRGLSSGPPIGSWSLRTRRNEYPTSGELAVFAGGNLEVEAIAVAVEVDPRGLGDKRQGAGEGVSRSDPHAEARLRATVSCRRQHNSGLRQSNLPQHRRGFCPPPDLECHPFL